jgi:hypothetical protein
MNWKGSKGKACVLIRGHVVCLDGLEKVMANLSQDNWFTDRDLNPRLPTQFRNLMTRNMVSEALISSIKVNLSLCLMK